METRSTRGGRAGRVGRGGHTAGRAGRGAGAKNDPSVDETVQETHVDPPVGNQSTPNLSVTPVSAAFPTTTVNIPGADAILADLPPWQQAMISNQALLQQQMAWIAAKFDNPPQQEQSSTPASVTPIAHVLPVIPRAQPLQTSYDDMLMRIHCMKPP